MQEMSRYIDADKLIEAIEDSIGCINFSSPYQDDNDAIVEGMERIKSIVDEAPTVDAVPVVHGRWIPVSERLPENEQEVEISCKRTYIASGNEEKTAYFTARAFYEDGKMNTEDSWFSWWDSCDNWEYDEEKDAYIIPEGWWEYVTFSEEFGVVDSEVLAWRPLTEPYKGE